MRILALLAAAFLAGQAEAKTVTLWHPDCPATQVGSVYQGMSNSGHMLFGDEWAACGFRYQSDGYYGGPEIVLHDDSGGIVRSAVTYLGGKPFIAASVHIYSYMQAFLAPEWTEKPTLDEMMGLIPGYENVGIKAFRNGVEVENLSWFQPSATGKTVDLSYLGEIDRLVLELRQPDVNPANVRRLYESEGQLYWDGAEMPNGEVWCNGDFCGQLEASVTLDTPAPVPLPATLPLLAGALLLLRSRARYRTGYPSRPSR